MIGEFPFYVMVDDFQKIQDESALDLICFLIDDSPWNMHFFFTVRGESPHFLASYILKGKVRIFEAKWLCFTDKETKELLREMTVLGASCEIADRIQKYMGGWPAGIMFACLALKANGNFDNFLPPVMDTPIFDYIEHEIFRTYSQEIQTILIELSYFERFDEELYSHMIGRSDFSNILNYLIKEHLCQCNSSQKWYCYYPVFRDFFQSRQKEEKRTKILTKTIGYSFQNHDVIQKEETLLKVYCLGSFSVMAGEKVLMWRTQKTKELFACLFFYEGKGLNKKGLIFKLWPDMPEKKGSALFHTTVSYLRKTLAQSGMSNILQVKDHFYFLNMKKIWSDIGRLEEISRQVKQKETQIQVSPQEFIELYGGEYFGSEDYRWLIGKKEYAEQMFLQTARELAVREANQNHYGNAALILQKILEISDGSLDILRFLMICRIRQGDITAAARQYKRMRQVWAEEWEQQLPEDLMDFINEGNMAEQFHDKNSQKK